MILGLEGPQKLQKILKTMKKNLKEVGVENKRNRMDVSQNNCKKKLC
jgi:hypothetical protein